MSRCSAVLLCALLASGVVQAQWVEFVDESITRLSSADPLLGINDFQEKDFAWGDVDKDGDIDLVVVRKQPFTTAGKRINLLFLNENGVLVESTDPYVIDSDVPGDEGFFTPTNDRDVQLVDVNDDGWLDIVTAVTISDGDPKHIGHPRVYINRGPIGLMGDWGGFIHEDARIPTMLSYTGQSGFNPRFCSLAVGDVTGDDFPELWFGDYDSAGAGNPQPTGADFNDRLLVNDGTGFFSDDTQSRLTGTIDLGGSGNVGFEVSAFGAASVIADMNGDGLNDLVKQTALGSPFYTGIAYNTPGMPGIFAAYGVASRSSVYFVNTGDLNNDGMLDLVFTDDGADAYALNQGNDIAGRAQFVAQSFSYDAAGDDGFGGNNLIVDLNNDGWNDVLIADVDVDIPGCGRRMHIFRNLGGQPFGDVTLQEQTSGTSCSGGSSSCFVASIPASRLTGVHDVAVFDIDGDGWKDMVIGRCSGTEVWMNVPPFGLVFSYPLGIPAFVDPGQAFTFQTQVNAVGETLPVPGSARMFASVDGAPFSEVPLVHLGAELYEATLPAVPDCTNSVQYYFTAEASTGEGTFTDPEGAPAEFYTAVAALGTGISFQDGLEGNVTGWTVVNDPSLTGGGWELADPNGSFSAGQPAAPDEDAEAAQENIFAFVTQNGVPGANAALSDVDGGPTDLISPPLDLSGTDGVISYVRWFFSSSDDVLEVAVTSNGTDWVTVETVPGVGHNSWQVASFRVGDFVPPSATVQVRFRTSDLQNDSVTEAGVDLLRVEEFLCTPCGNDGQCDDGTFCNGVETCTDGACTPAPNPCPDQVCDEANTQCVDCLVDNDCADGSFCNGLETCAGNLCQPGPDPCPGELCDDELAMCVDCLMDAECDDGVFCNGNETCTLGVCQASQFGACVGLLCDEEADTCLGDVEPQPRMGQPLSRLLPDEIARFDIGRIAFERTFTEGEGLGPVFNQNSCISCHNTPFGGSGSITVTRFGFDDEKGAGFDPLTNLGGSLLQAQAISGPCAEMVPPEANVVATRITPPVLGVGLIEAIADADIEDKALNPPPGISGRVHMAPILENPGMNKVGRFGWKSQLATVLSFSGDATLNEMGITNRVVPLENAPNGDPILLSQCDAVSDPEDFSGMNGTDFVDQVTDFQRLSAAPPQTPRGGMTGEVGFNLAGCQNCHTPLYITVNNPEIEDALRSQVIKPYSDFLLHDMGANGDFIEQGDAGTREMRTTPLWGIRVRAALWHDGRVNAADFNQRILDAIALHDSAGSEAAASAQSFATQPQILKDGLLRFLGSLGRAEFDFDVDNDVDADDHQAFLACFTGPGTFYTADDDCAVGDVDQDGDVDDDDFQVFLAVAEGSAGEVPDGFGLPGTPLTVNPAGAGQLDLQWGASCGTPADDYAVYEGTLGDFTSHLPVTCATGGMTSALIDPAAGSTYYLVVPTGGFREGGYGFDSAGLPRSASTGACLPQTVEACP